MERFSKLLERLILTPQRNGKIQLLVDYFAETPDPDRGFGVAAITGELEISSFKPAMLRTLVYERVDEVLFDLSYDYVGDLAETVSLIWPGKHGANAPPALTDIVNGLQEASRAEAPRLVEDWLDALDATGRWTLIKLVTGGFRIGVSSRLTKTALAKFGNVDVNEIEELWHSLDPPYTDLLTWLDGSAPKPAPDQTGAFRPVMLAHPLEEKDLDGILAETHMAEWKWDGIRVQAVSEGSVRRLYSRTGDDIGKAFPDVLANLNFEGVLDGELLVFAPDENGFVVQPFSELQKRLNRKNISKKLLETHPAFIRAYDALSLSGDDLRALPFEDRRRKLEAFMVGHDLQRVDLSPLVAFSSTDDLAAFRAAPPASEIEGLMIKKKSAPYVPGRPKGEWWKWKREPFVIDAVLMYAQRGHGKRSSFYSDYTFGVWTEDKILVPVGKAYFGFTDEELKQIDKFVRDHTTDRFGPVRQVKADTEIGLVLEVAFEGLNRSPRHKSGVAMRFPRISRLRWDKPPAEADHLETLEALLP
ncbi:MAG: cisplatin damage response ATP-dependent DNA ligase [Pseudomonadota bacterium]